jgi:hypothetical protein
MERDRKNSDVATTSLSGQEMPLAVASTAITLGNQIISRQFSMALSLPSSSLSTRDAGG